MKHPKLECGIFSNGMAYAKWGSGSKNLLYIPGGPGNNPPAGLMVKLELGPLKSFLEDDYTLWVIARKQNMPEGHSVADMAADYASLIKDEFNGKVNLVVGTSYGGMIGFYLAANHDNCFDHITILVAAYEVNTSGKQVDYDMAKYISVGNRWQAGVVLSSVLWPNSRFPRLMGLAGYLLTLMGGKAHPYLNSDVMVEAEAEKDFNSKDVLPSIKVPVLLIGSDTDLYFPMEIMEETASLIPNCTFKIYKGRGHIGAATDKRIPQDIKSFMSLRD
jgi:pimeloyl-ACP methyl ester carboxylesterase